MTALPPFDRPTFDYAAPQSLHLALQFKNADLFETLALTPRLRSLMESRLEARLGPLDPLPVHERHILSAVLSLSAEALNGLSRIIAVLVQAETLALVTDGQVLRRVTDFAGTRDVLPMVRRGAVAKIGIFPESNGLSDEYLTKLAKLVSRYVIGVLPTGYQRRLALLHPIGSLPAPLNLQGTDEDRTAFLELVEVGQGLLRTQIRHQTTAEDLDENAQVA